MNSPNKLTNSQIDNRLIGRNIKRLEDYPGNNKTHMKWQCTVSECNYVWITSASLILNNKTDCPRCSGKEPLTDLRIDQKLVNRNIKRLNNSSGNKIRINWECILASCGYIWMASPDNLLNNKSGCPKCAGLAPLNNQIVDNKLSGRNIKRLNDYISNGTEIEWQCLVENCGYIWKTQPNHVLNMMKSGCPKCSGCAPLTNDIVDNRIIDMKIKRLNDVNGAMTKINWQCLVNDCNYIWQTTPNGILNDNTGCPNCAYGKNERIVYEILKKYNSISFFRHHDIRKTFKNENRLLLVDFYLPDQNIIIEYNGVQHYQPTCFGGISIERATENLIKQQARDFYLQNFCDTNNIKLIWIDGRIYTNDKLKNYLIETIIPLFK